MIEPTFIIVIQTCHENTATYLLHPGSSRLGPGGGRAIVRLFSGRECQMDSRVLHPFTQYPAEDQTSHPFQDFLQIVPNLPPFPTFPPNRTKSPKQDLVRSHRISLLAVIFTPFSRKASVGTEFQTLLHCTNEEIWPKIQKIWYSCRKSPERV